MDSIENVERSIYLEQLRKKIDSIIENPRHRDIMRLRFGLLPDGRERTLEEVGQLFGVSRERIRQIENKCIAKIQCKLRTKQSDEWISV